jgi:alpha-ketoglutarate-dependent taurine dioxygenase
VRARAHVERACHSFLTNSAPVPDTPIHQVDLMWHCDDSFRDPQPLGSLFFCVEAPTDGAQTWFASGTAAFAALSPARQHQLASFAAVHDYNTLNEILRVS